MSAALSIREDLTVDSVTVADRCNVEHKATLQLLKVHGPKLEERFGRVTFEMAPFATKGGVQKRRIAHLTEDQATAFITLFQNTEKVVDFKFALVAAFAEAKRRLAESEPTEDQINRYLAKRYFANTLPRCAYGALTRDGRPRIGYRGPTFTASKGRTAVACEVHIFLTVQKYLPGFEILIGGTSK